MVSISSIFSHIEAAYRRTERKFLSLNHSNGTQETLVAQCMKLFGPLYLDPASLLGLEAYFRYLVHDVTAISDIPFNFFLCEDGKKDGVIQALLDAMALITNEEQAVQYVEEERLLTNLEEELNGLGERSVYVIQSCVDAPMTPEEYTAWSAAVELFDKTPRIVKILCAPAEVIEKRFRAVDHLYYRVFRNRLRAREATSDDMYESLLEELEKRGFSSDEDFLTDIRAYIDTVYPKADLKEKAFVSDLIERIVHKYYEKSRAGLALDAECVPFYRKKSDVDEGAEQTCSDVLNDEKPAEPMQIETSAAVEPTEPVSDASDVGKTVSAAEYAYDPTVDDYTAAGEPITKELLIVSLSTIRKDKNNLLEESTYDGSAYCYQLEPITMKLAQNFAKSGRHLDEILMLATEKALRQEACSFPDGTSGVFSAQGLYMDRVRKIPGFEQVRFVSVLVEPGDPVKAVSETVEHLRQVRKRNQYSPRVHLATNGGLRGNQQMLEAILSLLKSEGINVNPHDVWSVEFNSKERKASVLPGYQEFKIFDFVSGINEFRQYGRIDLLSKFWDDNSTDASLRLDNPGRKLMSAIVTIAEGIRFNDIATLEDGIRRLRAYYYDCKHGVAVSTNPYIRLFNDEIAGDYGALVDAKSIEELDAPLSPLDEIKWCAKKGLYMQAYTIAETRMPAYLFALGMLSADEFSLASAEAVLRRYKNQKDDCLVLFNTVVSRFLRFQNNKYILPSDANTYRNGRNVKVKEKLAEFQEKMLSPGQNKSETVTLTYKLTVPSEFDKFILSHFFIKTMRNCMCHPDSGSEFSAQDFKQELNKYMQTFSTLLDRWKNSDRQSPLRVELVNDEGFGVLPSPEEAKRTTCSASNADAQAGRRSMGICSFSTKEIVCCKEVPEQSRKLVREALLNKGKDPNGKDPVSQHLKEFMPKWREAVSVVSGAKSPNDVERRLEKARPLLLAIALRELGEQHSSIKNISESEISLTWNQLSAYTGSNSAKAQKQLVSWLNQTLAEGELASSAYQIFVADK